MAVTLIPMDVKDETFGPFDVERFTFDGHYFIAEGTDGSPIRVTILKGLYSVSCEAS